MSAANTAIRAARHGACRLATTAAQPALFDSEPAPLPATGLERASAEAEQSEQSEEGTEWSDEEIVALHGMLFDTCVEKLNDPETPLDELIEWLRWIFSEPGTENLAFSFSNTLKLYRRPPAREIRCEIQSGLRRYLTERLQRYPAWVAEAFWSDPDRFAGELERNPQWVNEGVRRHSRDGDMFVA